MTKREPKNACCLCGAPVLWTSSTPCVNCLREGRPYPQKEISAPERMALLANLAVVRGGLHKLSESDKTEFIELLRPYLKTVAVNPDTPSARRRRARLAERVGEVVRWIPMDPGLAAAQRIVKALRDVVLLDDLAELEIMRVIRDSNALGPAPSQPSEIG